MKKLILMTSALTLIGGAASAAITLSAEATVTYGNWDTGGGAAMFEFGTSLEGTFEETTAGGVTYGASLTIEDLDSVEQGVIWFQGGFGKVSFGTDKFEEIEDAAGDDAGDVQWAYDMGQISSTITADVDGNGTTDWDVILGYDGGSFSLGLETDSSNLTEVSVEFDAGNFTVGGSAASDDSWEVSVEFDAGNFTVGGSAASDDSWDVFVGTTFGDVDAKVTHDSDSVTGVELGGMAGGVDWEVTWNTDDEITADLSADLGGASVSVAYDSTNTGGTGDDAVTVVEVTIPAGDNLEFGILVNDADEYELSATAGFVF